MVWWAEERLEAEMARAQHSFLAQACLTHQPSGKVFLDVEVFMCILFNLQLFCHTLLQSKQWVTSVLRQWDPKELCCAI